MYNLIMYLMQMGIAIAAMFNEKARELHRGQHEALRVLKENIDPAAEYVWFHAASLGEFEQGRPLMERLRAEFPSYKILLTFFSPSGYEVRKDYKGADIVCYMPVDTPSNARRFVELAHPKMAFFIKYEFWYNFLAELRKRQTPTFSVSSIFRADQIFFRWYGAGYRKVLSCITFFFVQNAESKELLARLGYDNVAVTGDTRFDRVLQIRRQAKQLPVIEAFTRGFKVFVAGSSWPPDEDIFIRYFNDHPGWRLIIAPHVIAEDHLNQILSKLKCSTERYTQATVQSVADARCLLIDCFGILSSAYGYGNVAYVGGGFGVGIHNVLEAAAWNMPVIFGPNNRKFMEARGLLKAKGGFEINVYDDFEQLMDTFTTDDKALKDAGDAAGEFVKSCTGATDIIFDKVMTK